MKCLFLDDVRIPLDVYSYTNDKIYLDNWDIVRNYDSFLFNIKNNGMPDIISFDHDLGYVHYQHQNMKTPYNEYVEKTGYHCAKWLIEYSIDNNIEIPSKILIHSMNIVGSKNIESLFTTYNKVFKKNIIIIRLL